MPVAEYIWIDGYGELCSKTRTIKHGVMPPMWGFDGSSTGQAMPDGSDCILKPVRTTPDTTRWTEGSLLVLCEVYDNNGEPDKNNHRVRAMAAYEKFKDQRPLFGIEQEYTIYRHGYPACLVGTHGIVPVQKQFYCSPQNSLASKIPEVHMECCLDAGLRWCGMNAEVMPGQWEFQIGPADPITVADDLWLARYILIRQAKAEGYQISLIAKPHEKLNGAGAHTNFSTEAMRKSYSACIVACEKLGRKVIDASQFHGIHIMEDVVHPADKYPAEYGTGYEHRLIGKHETCSWKEFKWGVSDRTASIRIPRHVKESGENCYIEDRRPCANADPYSVVSYMMETICDPQTTSGQGPTYNA